MVQTCRKLKYIKIRKLKFNKWILSYIGRLTMMDTQNVETYDIFISHSQDDYDKVSSYLSYLENELYGFGKFFPVFIAHKDITPSKK